MRRFGTVRLLLLMAVLQKGACGWVDLSKEVDGFFKHSHRNGVSHWGLTETYFYWTLKHNRTGLHPIKAKVNGITCGAVHSSFHTHQTNCEETFVWNIVDGLETPFNLRVDVSLPMFAGGSKTMATTIELNGRRGIEVARKTGRKAANTETVAFKQTCNFTAPVVFDGYFAYYWEHARGEEPNYRAVPVSNLHDNAKGLYADGTKLKYTVKGMYKQTLCYVRTIWSGKRPFL